MAVENGKGSMKLQDVIAQLQDPKNVEKLAMELAMKNGPAPQIPQMAQAPSGPFMTGQEQGRVQAGEAPSKGIRPGMDAAVRVDQGTLTDEEFAAKWGMDKQGNMIPSGGGQ